MRSSLPSVFNSPTITQSPTPPNTVTKNFPIFEIPLNVQPPVQPQKVDEPGNVLGIVALLFFMFFIFKKNRLVRI